MTSHPRSILFVDGLWVEKFGITSLIPPLEAAGYRVELLLTRNTRKLLRHMEGSRPAWLAFSVTTGYHLKALEMAAAAREAFPGVRILFGGPHVTYFPEVILDGRVDVAVRGECDLRLPEILDRVSAGEDPATIPNLVYADGHEVAFGPLDPLVEELDSLPFPDRRHFYRYRLFRTSPYKAFIVSRGCPYDCAFCFNHKLRALYRGKGRFLRLRSPESIVEEARFVQRKYGMKLASFEDDLLTYDKGWLVRLLTLWREQVGTPYNLNATAGTLCDEELVRLLKETGAWTVAFGVETGSETLRRKLLAKPLTNDQIETAASLLNRHGVRFLTYNMFALPGERFEDALETLRLNRRIGTQMARYTLFQPYPGTQLGDAVGREAGQSEMLYHHSPLATEDARRIERLQKFAMLGMRSQLGEKAGIVASRLPDTPLNTLVFWTTYFNVVRRYMQTGYTHLLELGLRSLTNLF
jgi:anaerobic magnesium-protoporphyrin IX monomethyl ester cyclase